MNTITTSPRQHPDIFNPEEAAEYLHLDRAEGLRTLQTLREQGVLSGFRLGPTLMYHRRDLDLAADKIFGVIQTLKTKPSEPRKSGPKLRISGE